MAETLTVEVRAEHVAAGVPGQPAQCPLALAIKEQTGRTYGVYVWDTSVNIDERQFDLSPVAERFVHQFDAVGRELTLLAPVECVLTYNEDSDE